MPEVSDLSQIPTDYVGPVLAVRACSTHGAHIDFNYCPEPGTMLELAQINPTQAQDFVDELTNAIEIAQREIDAWKAGKN